MYSDKRTSRETRVRAHSHTQYYEVTGPPHCWAPPSSSKSGTQGRGLRAAKKRAKVPGVRVAREPGLRVPSEYLPTCKY